MAQVQGDTDAAYAAGLFDGEGCVEVYMQSSGRRGKDGKRRSLRVCLSVSGVDTKPLYWLQEHYGGTVRVGRNGISPNKRPIGRWGVYGDESEMFAKAILPYVIVKREQLELWFEARRLFTSFKGRPRTQRLTDEELLERAEIADRVKVLKHVG